MKKLSSLSLVLLLSATIASAEVTYGYDSDLGEINAAKSLGSFPNPISLPVYFAANPGQMAEGILYSAQLPGMRIDCRADAIQFTFTRESLRLSFPGATARTVEARDLLPGKLHLFLGQDRTRWRTNLPTYGEVVYRDLYPGIDLILHGERGRLKYTLRVAPGADPSRIRLRYQGAQKIEVDQTTGELVVYLSQATLRDAAPVAYQLREGRPVLVPAQFHLANANEVVFSLGDYDRSRELVIDPGYATYLGGSDEDAGLAIAIDSSANVYVAGKTQSLNFPTQNPYQASHAGGDYDVFVSKIAADGQTLLYSTYLGGSGDDGGFASSPVNAVAIAVDSSGNAYVTGLTRSNDFPVQNAYQSAFGGGDEDVFVTKLDANGQITASTYSTYLGGSNVDHSHAITVDSAGNAYLCGRTDSPDFPLQNAFQSAHGGISDAFVTKLDSSGQITASTYSTFLGGTGDEDAFGIAVDPSGNAYVAGVTQSSTTFPLQNAYQGTFGGGTIDGYIAKFDASGQITASTYSTFLGGSGNDECFDIAVDSSGNAYVTGETSSPDFPTQNAFDATLGGPEDGFVTKFDANGQITTSTYSTFLGGSQPDVGFGIAVDSSGNAYVTGETSSPDFPTQNAFQGTLGGAVDAFVSKLNSSGQITASTYSTYLGGSDNDSGLEIAVTGSGEAYVVGRTSSSTDFPVYNALQSSYGGGAADAFIASYTSDGSLPVTFSAVTAMLDADGVTLFWRTESEVDNLGFHVYRSRAQNGPYTRVNRALIPGARNSAASNSYAFTDETVQPGETYYYYIEDVDLKGNTGRSEIIRVVVEQRTLAEGLPSRSALLPNYPNPFNPETWIPYELAQEAVVRIEIYTLQGKLVRTLDLGKRSAGRYLERHQAAYWDGRDATGQPVSSGVYTYTLRAGDFHATRRMVVLK